MWLIFMNLGRNIKAVVFIVGAVILLGLGWNYKRMKGKIKEQKKLIGGLRSKETTAAKISEARKGHDKNVREIRDADEDDIDSRLDNLDG